MVTFPFPIAEIFSKMGPGSLALLASEEGCSGQRFLGLGPDPEAKKLERGALLSFFADFALLYLE